MKSTAGMASCMWMILMMFSMMKVMTSAQGIHALYNLFNSLENRHINCCIEEGVHFDCGSYYKTVKIGLLTLCNHTLGEISPTFQYISRSIMLKSP